MIYRSKHKYKPSLLHRNAHLSTILPTSNTPFRPLQFSRRETINTPDDDFFEVDLYEQNSSSLAIMIHGLEGNSDAHYMHRIGNTLSESGLDIAAMNLRGCSTINKHLHYYHSGFTTDLHQYVQTKVHEYEFIYLIGVSVGGNIVLKYIGEQGDEIHPKVKKAFVLSAPCDLKGSAEKLSKGFNKIYLNRFLKRLRKKVMNKQKANFEVPNLNEVLKAKNFQQFDDLFTSPHFDFDGADDYYQKTSSRHFLKTISIPTLLLSSNNDPFLSDNCYPKIIGKSHPFFHILFLKKGGHVGFQEKDKSFYYQKVILEHFFSL